MKSFILPIISYLSMWIIVTICLKANATYDTYQLNMTYLIVFMTSFISLIIGVLFPSIFQKVKCKNILNDSIENSIIALESNYAQKILKKILIISILFISLLFTINFITDGLPPFFAFFGFDALGYSKYGRFLGFLIPISSTLIVLSIFFKSKKLSYISFFIGISVVILYVNRGPLIFSLFQFLLFKLLIDYYRMNKKRFYFKYFILLFLFSFSIIYLMAIVGEYRSGLASFKIYLRITDEAFENYNIGILWVITYFSIPASNFFHYLDQLGFKDIESVTFLANVLPAFLKIKDTGISVPISNLDTTIDGVHFYLYNWYAGLSYLGIIIINFTYGIMISLFRKNIFLYVSAMTIITFSFFIDYLFYFPTLVQLSIFIYISIKVRKVHFNDKTINNNPNI